jgi:hypothetical protein
MGLEFGVNGLREAGFGETDGLGFFEVEKGLEFLGREILYHGIMDEVFQYLLAAGIGDIRGNQHKMQLAFIGAQSFAANDQTTSFQNEREKPLDGMGLGWFGHVICFEVRPLSLLLCFP